MVFIKSLAFTQASTFTVYLNHSNHNVKGVSAMSDFYIMPMFVKLEVKSVEESTKWYREALGFSSVFELPGGDGSVVMAHLRGTKYQDILLIQNKTAPSPANSGGVVIHFSTNDIDSLDQKVRAKNAEIIEGPVIRPWNAREIVIKDLDGYVIAFSSQIDGSKAFDEVMDGIQLP